MNHTKILALIGPTASGKTAIAIELAKRTQAEIVSADSVQIYRHMDIGSAKPTQEERQGIAHHMIDIIDPDQPYSVAQFQQQARAATLDIARRGKLPIVVGGSGLYVGAILYDLDFSATKADEAFRRACEQHAALYGNDSLYDRLRRQAPDRAAQLHPNDVKRVIRALEQVELGEMQPKSFQRTPYYADALWFGLTMPREKLYHRIDRRVDCMMRAGFLEEVAGLRALGYTDALPSMQSLGYRELTAYLEAPQGNLADAVERIKRDTRRFAKRQMTWFRRDEQTRWLDVQGCSREQIIDTMIHALGNP